MPGTMPSTPDDWDPGTSAEASTPADGRRMLHVPKAPLYHVQAHDMPGRLPGLSQFCHKYRGCMSILAILIWSSTLKGQGVLLQLL